MITFTLLDWFWLLAFLVLMTLCGVLFYRLGKRSESDFFLAGRGLPWWLPASSVFATHTATDSPMWISGVIYRYGMPGIWYGFFAAWCATSAFISTRIFRRSLAYSQAEWQTLRFSGLGAELLRGWMAGWQIFMQMFIMGWVGMAMGKVCNYVFGWGSSSLVNRTCSRHLGSYARLRAPYLVHFSKSLGEMDRLTWHRWSAQAFSTSW